MSDNIKITPIVTDIPMPPMSAVPDCMAVRHNFNQVVNDLEEPINTLDGVGLMVSSLDRGEYGGLGIALDVILQHVIEDLRRLRKQVKGFAAACKEA